MIRARAGPISARPGSKNTSLRADWSARSSVLSGAGAEGAAEVEDELEAIGLGAVSAGESSGERCSWTGAGGAGCVDAVGDPGAGGSVFAVFAHIRRARRRRGRRWIHEESSLTTS